MTIRRILFLDFDGVLNSKDNEDAICSVWADGIGKSKDGYGYLFDQRCVHWLNHIHHVTSCQYVISSTWRWQGIENIRDMFTLRGINGDIIGVTPLDEFSELRGFDVQGWIKDNGREGDQYCILDDQCDFLPNQIDNILVRTDPKYGLTRYSAYSVISKFGC